MRDCRPALALPCGAEDSRIGRMRCRPEHAVLVHGPPEGRHGRRGAARTCSDAGGPGQQALRPDRRIPRDPPARDRPGAGRLGGAGAQPRPQLRGARGATGDQPLLHRRAVPDGVLLRAPRARRRGLAHGAALRPDPGRQRVQLLSRQRREGPHGAGPGLPRVRGALPGRPDPAVPGARRGVHARGRRRAEGAAAHLPGPRAAAAARPRLEAAGRRPGAGRRLRRRLGGGADRGAVPRDPVRRRSTWSPTRSTRRDG